MYCLNLIVVRLFSVLPLAPALGFGATAAAFTPVPFTSVKIDDAFWLPRVRLVQSATLRSGRSTSARRDGAHSRITARPNTALARMMVIWMFTDGRMTGFARSEWALPV